MGLSILSFKNLEINNGISSALSNWNLIPHKGMKALPQEEIIKELKELAEKAKNTTNSTELSIIDNRKTALCAQYMSYASPDRKLLFEQAQKAMNSQRQQQRNKPIGEISLLYFLEKYKKDKDTQYTKQTLSCGGVLTPVTNPMGNGFEISVVGESVLCYDGGRLSYIPTAAEQARAQEFYRVYDIAYNHSNTAETENKQTNSESYFYEDNILLSVKNNKMYFDKKV